MDPSSPAPGRPALPLAISVGEPAGIGAEIVARAFERRNDAGLPPFYLLADPDFVFSRLARARIGVRVETTTPEGATACFRTALPVVPLAARMGDRPGRPDPADAPAVVEAIETAVRHVAEGRAAGLVTAPIQKATLYAAGFDHPGHTEFLGALAARHYPGEPAEPVMMLAGPDLSTVPVTVHIPLSAVPGALTTERIVTVGRIVARDLQRRFGIDAPRLALAGLNPHAGEDGTMGLEDRDVIAPAVARLVADGIRATGPHPADTLFHARARKAYDVVLAMYHDQALIPVKTIAFDETVNVTLGLPFVRTSPDHGTALDIAGKDVALPDSLIAAIQLAGRMVARAKEAGGGVAPGPVARSS
ncbi:4-hydroxythreonine-4-phosphate dehydrogenase PdxA [Mongoliimonas terrestris]|uniref:4-hydroxythreonine-4-phosphate dehydrogenase PdxA n=1 Tax=Mongoliimonas terrestris TaxID=1709001 RepID=UPI00094996D9|nr:4-hydroxythreonine-4-phosphate dehydrogenase PdxA [Mongoliimonas terrestris]